jgi:hypothetical protein
VITSGTPVPRGSASDARSDHLHDNTRHLDADPVDLDDNNGRLEASFDLLDAIEVDREVNQFCLEVKSSDRHAKPFDLDAKPFDLNATPFDLDAKSFGFDAKSFGLGGNRT